MIFVNRNLMFSWHLLLPDTLSAFPTLAYVFLQKTGNQTKLILGYFPFISCVSFHLRDLRFVTKRQRQIPGCLFPDSVMFYCNKKRKEGTSSLVWSGTSKSCWVIHFLALPWSHTLHSCQTFGWVVIWGQIQLGSLTGHFSSLCHSSSWTPEKKSSFFP